MLIEECFQLLRFSHFNGQNIALNKIIAGEVNLSEANSTLRAQISSEVFLKTQQTETKQNAVKALVKLIELNSFNTNFLGPRGIEIIVNLLCEAVNNPNTALAATNGLLWLAQHNKIPEDSVGLATEVFLVRSIDETTKIEAIKGLIELAFYEDIPEDRLGALAQALLARAIDNTTKVEATKGLTWLMCNQNITEDI